MRWHQTGWVHQGLASFNILFFSIPGNTPSQTESQHSVMQTINYDEPFLMGFDYARETDASSALRRQDHSDAERIRDLYRHPDGQGPAPLKKHQRQHYLYSLGLVLTEIARWAPLQKAFQKVISGQNGATKVHKAALKMASAVLGYNMGTAYRDATLACLRGDLGVEEDNKQGTRFISEFETQVVQKLETWSQIDGDFSI